MKANTNKFKASKQGAILVLIVMAIVVLTMLGMSLLNVAWGVRHRAILLKTDAVAMMAADAGYEKAVFWLSQQPDALAVLSKGPYEGTINFTDGICKYSVSIHEFFGIRPVYRITVQGSAGKSQRSLDAYVFQAMGGWESTHRVPSGPSSTVSWMFGNGEVLDIPMQVNKWDDNPDVRDIYIQGSPKFLQSVGIGESRRTSGGSDKYGGVMDLFQGGISFDQPDSKINQKSAVQTKLKRFADTTAYAFKFKPLATAPLTRPNAAVQLEFFVDGGVGKIRITNNCTVRGYRYEDNPGPNKTYDYLIDPAGDGDSYIKYDIYAYHVKSSAEPQTVVNVTDTYVTQQFGSITTEPGGQIFVDGNVIIGGDDLRHNNNQVVQGRITVVATGHIWVADSIKVDGSRTGSMPAEDNPNILGLVAQGVIKVIDPGMSDYSYVDDEPVEPAGYVYVPVALPDGSIRHQRLLPGAMEVEAVITVGGGGWGAENVGNRKASSGGSSYDKLVVRGSISEAMRGIVGAVPPLWSGYFGGYSKNYYLDERVLQGILPGNITLKGKFIPAPGGWHDYRPGK